jgi:hypothetical protein
MCCTRTLISSIFTFLFFKIKNWGCSFLWCIFFWVIIFPTLGALLGIFFYNQAITRVDAWKNEQLANLNLILNITI